MIKVNDKNVSYTRAYYAYAFNDALDPTGLGSMGVYFEYEDLKIYIGIKNDVIDFITNKNTDFFINLQDDEIAKSNELTQQSKFGDGIVKDVYINQIKISIDVALFRNYVYKTHIEDYVQDYSLTVAKEQKTYGALLRLEIPFILGVDALFIGFIYTGDKELLVLDKAIVDKDTLLDEVWYNIWKIKANIVPHTLQRQKSAMLFEKTYSYQDKGYNDYYANQYDTYTGISLSKKEDALISYETKMAKTIKNNKVNTLNFVDKNTQNLDYDIFVSFNTAVAPGIVNGQNMVNFGVKEARRGYWNLSKGRTFDNIGYRTKTDIVGDNFYVSTAPVAEIEQLSPFMLPLSTDILFPPEISFNNEILTDITERTMSAKPKTKQEAFELLVENLEKVYGKKSTLAFLVKNKTLKVTINFGIPYLHLIGDGKIAPGKTVIFTHPFYPNSYAVHVNSNNIKYFSGLSFTSPLNGHVFGYIGNKYYFKSIDKDFRPDKCKTFGNISVYEDLISYNNKPEYENSSVTGENLFLKEVGFLYDNFDSMCQVYIVDTDKLIEQMGSDRGVQYPLGYEKCYVKAEK